MSDSVSPPELDYAAVTQAGTLVTVVTKRDVLVVENKGPDPVTIGFDAIPAVAGFGDDKKVLAVYESYAIPSLDADFSAIGLICATGKTASVEISSKCVGSIDNYLKEWTGIKPKATFNPGGGY